MGAAGAAEGKPQPNPVVGGAGSKLTEAEDGGALCASDEVPRCFGCFFFFGIPKRPFKSRSTGWGEMKGEGSERRKEKQGRGGERKRKRWRAGRKRKEGRGKRREGVWAFWFSRANETPSFFGNNREPFATLKSAVSFLLRCLFALFFLLLLR